MRRLFVFNYVTADGYLAGPNGELDWHPLIDELDAYAQARLSQADTILFGRVTYQLMAPFWPTPEAMRDDPVIASFMNSTTKLVFSRTLEHVEWENSTLARGELAAEVLRLKQQPGKEIVILGSGSLVAAGTQLGLIDEYVLIVVPIILGAGKSQFGGYRGRLGLSLTGSRVFGDGILVLTYEPISVA